MARKKPDMKAVMWSIRKLKTHPRQAALFRDLPDAELKELAEDIAANGQRVPIEVLPDGTILCGHQRVRALKLLGRKQAMIMVCADLAADEQAAVRRMRDDNEHRRQLTTLDLARSYQGALEVERGRQPGELSERDRGTLRDRVARKFGKSGRNIARYLAILKLPIPLQEAFEAGHISLIDGDKLSQLPQNQLVTLARAVVERQPARHLVRDLLASNRKVRGGLTSLFHRFIG